MFLGTWAVSNSDFKQSTVFFAGVGKIVSGQTSYGDKRSRTGNFVAEDGEQPQGDQARHITLEKNVANRSSNKPDFN